MVLECQGCHQSYDVSSYKTGQRLRCQCGQILVVPGKGPEVHAARTLHCSNCGGNLKRGEKNCSFCGALVDLTHTRLTAYCSACLSMSKEGAKFCSGCGKPLVAQVDAPSEANESCPHCQVRMRRRGVGEHKPLECPICCGLFIEVHVLDKIIRNQEQRIGEVGSGTKEPERAALKAKPVTYIKCPVCDGIMNRLNYGRISGVIIDYCRKHGYWLDAGELEKIAKWVATGGLNKQYAREMEDMKAEKSRLSRTMADTASMSLDDYDRRGLGSSTSSTGGLIDFVSKLFDL
ncbi:MAG: hypothetical protein GY847_30715 [Proteobacteria bacterium]|nr:hypothetical protein [Pseudomonadota bacterium]